MDLAVNIKQLRKLNKISQDELAKELGVSQTSIVHYEKGDRQPSIENLILMSDIFQVSIDTLVGNKQHLVVETDDAQEAKISVPKLVDLLLKKKDQMFYDYLDHLSKQHGVEVIIEQVLKQVLYMIGNLWEKGLISEADEHYATNIVRIGIHFISANKPYILKTKKAIALTVHSEQHTMGMEMISSILEDYGVETLYLGSNVPIKSLNRLIEDYRPDYILISITLMEHINSLATMLESIYRLESDKPIIIVGGQASMHAREVMQDISDVYFVEKLDELVQMI